MCSGSCPTSKLYDKITKRPSKSHETIPLNVSSGKFPSFWTVYICTGIRSVQFLISHEIYQLPQLFDISYSSLRNA
jgi:hypothetical protein